MELIKAAKAVVPGWIKDIVDEVAPTLKSAQTAGAQIQFCCKQEAQPFFQTERLEELNVEICNTELAKTVVFATDGNYVDGASHNYADGYVKNRRVLSWKWARMENVVKDSDGREKRVVTVYTRDKQLHLELRRAIGLSGY